jgi:hypothetical protein
MKLGFRGHQPKLGPDKGQLGGCGNPGLLERIKEC